ncbi:MAG: prepilin-type N-terminal cleavage/methylation domain-containing protein [Candidatus Paceibacterota bacterium]
MIQNPKPKTGFTIIELLVVIGIITLLSTMAILYSHTGERQIILFQEQIKILNALSRAKSLTINTFIQSDVPCGFGVHFDESNNSFRIFRELAIQPDCLDADFQYSGASEDFLVPEVFNLNPVITFDSLVVDDIIFYPPAPSVAILPGFQEEAIIGLKIIGSTQPPVIIKVNKEGMITTQ